MRRQSRAYIKGSRDRLKRREGCGDRVEQILMEQRQAEAETEGCGDRVEQILKGAETD